jgi:class 3 adenylate cyclase/ActR/RegA family two-component response regulator
MASVGAERAAGGAGGSASERQITVLLADDNLLVRTGVKTLLRFSPGVEVVGEAADFDELITAADELMPQVVVTDIRMPPSFQQEGIEAAKLIRKRHPGTGVVILSQYDDPEYAVALLSEDTSGYAYLLKDHVGDGDQLIRAIQEVATGGSMLDPTIVRALVAPVRAEGELNAEAEQLLQWVAEGKPVKAIAVALGVTPAAANEMIEHLFLDLAKEASSGRGTALRRLRSLQAAIAEKEAEGESMSRMLPGGLAEKLRRDGRRPGESERLTVTVLMSDVRGYSAIAECTDPTALATQLHQHRAEMNRAVLAEGGTVMQYIGDAVMAVFGAPFPSDDHADRAVAAAFSMHEYQDRLNAEWERQRLPAFGMGIGVSTGDVAAALLGSEERLEYTLVGDTVNMAQRLQDLARPAGTTIVSAATLAALSTPVEADELPETTVKGRAGAVQSARLRPRATAVAGRTTATMAAGHGEGAQQ